MITAGLILIGVGFVFLILGIIFYILGRKNNRSKQIEGKIVDMCYNSYMYNHSGNGNVKAAISSGSTSPSSSCPVFEYRVNGVTYRRAGKVAYNRGQLLRIMGQPRMVYYDPRNPEDASLSNTSPLKVLGIVFSLLGGAVLLIGLIFLVVM